MPLTRLRQILQSQYSVQLDSSATTIQKVRDRIKARQAAFTRQGKTVLSCKTPAAVPLVTNTPLLTIRAIDLLKKIGELTTPSWANMASLSASWATRRYFWAIAESNRPRTPFRLNDEVRELDYHQKTLLSDEFGVGMAGIVVERLFSAPQFVDVSIALRDPALYQNVRAAATAQPDYLMWSSRPATPYYVVECKGSQTNVNVSLGQLRRGMEQVPSLVFSTGPRTVNTLVVATLLRRSGTVVYVVDPPDQPNEEHPDSPSERIDKRTWRIKDPETFALRSWNGRRSQLLRWAGQFVSAARIDRELAFGHVREFTLRDQPLERRVVADMTFQGRATPFFPELGEPRLRIFTGVQEDLLRAAITEPIRSEEIATSLERQFQRKVEHPQAGQEEPNVSVGPGGSCLIVDGLF